MPGEIDHSASVQRIASGMAEAVTRKRSMESDALAADLIGRILGCLRDGTPGAVCYTAQAKAVLWQLARGTSSNSEFQLAVLAFQTLVTSYAAAGRDRSMRSDLDPTA